MGSYGPFVIYIGAAVVHHTIYCCFNALVTYARRNRKFIGYTEKVFCKGRVVNGVQVKVDAIIFNQAQIKISGGCTHAFLLAMGGSIGIS
jgi:hypothetical protein